MRKYFVEILSFDGSDFYNKLSKIRRNKDCYDFFIGCLCSDNNNIEFVNLEDAKAYYDNVNVGIFKECKYACFGKTLSYVDFDDESGFAFDLNEFIESNIFDYDDFLRLYNRIF